MKKEELVRELNTGTIILRLWKHIGPWNTIMYFQTIHQIR